MTTKLRINGQVITNPITIQEFQQLVQEDRDIMEESEVSLEELLEARDICSRLTERDFDFD